MRAPPESLSPIIGAPIRTARSITLQIFSAYASPSDAAEDGEILREDEDLAAVDRARAGDDAVAEDIVFVHPERGAAMHDEAVEFLDDPVSTSVSMRSRAVSFPRSCCLAIASVPAGAKATSLLAQLLVLFVVGPHGVPRCTSGRAHPGLTP